MVVASPEKYFNNLYGALFDEGYAARADVEGLAGHGVPAAADELHPVQQAFIDAGAVQCGFCTPGMLLTALAFLERHPGADREALRHAIEGNLCRCTGYAKILDALEDYSRG